MPRAGPCVPNRFGRTASASQRQNCWPRGTRVTRLYEEGSFALRLTSLSGWTPAFGSPLVRPAVLITSRFVCDSCSFHHDSSAKLDLAYQTLPYMLYLYAKLLLTPKPRVPCATACSAAAATSASAAMSVRCIPASSVEREGLTPPYMLECICCW